MLAIVKIMSTPKQRRKLLKMIVDLYFEVFSKLLLSTIQNKSDIFFYLVLFF